MKIRAIITGGTGMVGEGIIYESLNHRDVEAVLSITRQPLGITHPKLKEIIIPDFFDLEPIKDHLKGYNACYFCLGISSIDRTEEDYYNSTYNLTMHFAETLSSVNKNLTFCYLSGRGADRTEKGRILWARIKGKTENDLLRVPFKRFFSFRPGFIQPVKILTKTHDYYKYLNPLFPLGRLLFPKSFCTMHELAEAMINGTIYGFPKKMIEGNDIIKLAKNQLEVYVSSGELSNKMI